MESAKSTELREVPKSSPLTLESCEALVSDLRRSIKENTERMLQAEAVGDTSQWRNDEVRNINGVIQYMPPEMVAYSRAIKSYVLNEETEELALLADALLDARLYINYQEKVATDASYKEKIIKFNHKLRDLIVQIADVVPRQKIESWLGIFMRQNIKEAKKIIAGMGAEVAVYRAAVKEFGSANVELSDVGQDKRGVDLLVRVGGIWKEIDIKTGGNQGGGLGRTHEVDVDRTQIDGFDIIPEYTQGIINQIKGSAR